MANHATLMTECDNMSTASDVTSIFGGDTTDVIEELRATRRTINADRRRLVDEYARVQKLDELDQESDGPAYDDWRESWFESVGRYISSAKEKYESGVISYGQMDRVWDSVCAMKKYWDSSSFFLKKARYDAMQFPSKETFWAAAPKAGEKRLRNEFSMESEHFDAPPSSIPRTSSPIPPEQPEIHVNGHQIFVQPAAVPKKAAKATRQLPSPKTPTNNNDIQMWLENGTSSLNRTTMALKVRAQEEQLQSVALTSATLQSQNQELQNQLQHLRHQKDTEVAAASAAAAEKAGEEMRKQAHAAFDSYILQANQRVEAAMKEAEAARQSAASAAALRQQTDAAAMQRIESNERLLRERNRNAEEREKELVKLQKELEAFQLRLTQQAQEQERHAQQQLTQRNNDIFLPTTTPAVNSPRRDNVRQKTPTKTAEHPLHANLRQRQESSPNHQISDFIDISNDTQSSVTKQKKAAQQNSSFYKDCWNKIIETGKSDGEQGMSCDTKIRAKQLAIQKAYDSRPTKRFSHGSPIEFAMHMRRFESAVNNNMLDCAEILNELMHWFDGDAQTIVENHYMSPDKEEALAGALSELYLIFKEDTDSFTAVIRDITKGPQIDRDDINGHLNLYSKLRQAEMVVRNTGNESEFNRRDIMRAILKTRLAHLTDRFWSEDEKSKRINGRSFNFHDLMREIQSHMTILKNKGMDDDLNDFVLVTKKQKSPKIAATASAPARPPRQRDPKPAAHQRHQSSTAKCNYCTKEHETLECTLLLEKPVEKRVEALTKKNLCYHCMQPGHTARLCANRPSCNICGRKHATMMHDRKYEAPRPTEEQSASTSLPIRPFASGDAVQNNPTRPQPSAPSADAMA